MKITVDELNIGYKKVNLVKSDLLENGQVLPLKLEVDIDRDPLTSEYFDDSSNFVTPFTLKFELTWIGEDNKSPFYFLASEDIEISNNEDN